MHLAKRKDKQTIRAERHEGSFHFFMGKNLSFFKELYKPLS